MVMSKVPRDSDEAISEGVSGFVMVICEVSLDDSAVLGRY